MMAKGDMPTFRLKAKFQDKRMQTCPMRDGSKKEAERREIGVVWTEDGKHTFRFAAELEPAIVKALGGKPGDRVFFDLFDTKDDGARSGRAPAAPVEEDADF